MLLAKRDHSKDQFPHFDLFHNPAFFEDFLPTGNIAGEDRWLPAMDVSETETEYKVHLEAPGVEKDDIKAELNEGVLTITGEKKSETKDESKNHHIVERSYGRFARKLRFNDIDSEKISATFKNGVLEVTLSKIEAAKPKLIDIEQN
ncbi:MAG TPA: Hsp20/alpha crystallin family protein [Nitrospirae bacterium]|nr:Hsp20/alpha crystallin family protein [Nitrospirota bacterium]